MAFEAGAAGLGSAEAVAEATAVNAAAAAFAASNTTASVDTLPNQPGTQQRKYSLYQRSGKLQKGNYLSILILIMILKLFNLIYRTQNVR